MNLWDKKSNADTFNKSLPQEDKKREEYIKILGILWKPIKDEMQAAIQCTNKMDVASTKGHVITTTASLFDPVGLL